MATLYSSQLFKITTATGETLEIGAVDQKLELTLTNGLVFEARATITDDYGKDVMWATGQGGLDTFEVMFLYSDADVWVEFQDDSGDPADFMVRKFKAGIWHVLPGVHLGINDDTVFDGAVLVDNTDYDDVTQIEIMRNVDADQGDANVRLILMG